MPLVFLLRFLATADIIMLFYLVGRIVGIWIALIMSPAAFFVTAMPSNISGKVPSLDSEYWTKFGKLLTGGPIMAFFLWLTLATVSNGGLSVTTAPMAVQSGETQQVNQYFATSIGTADQFGSYIVALTLMFMGLGMAVEGSAAVAKPLGAVADKVRGYGIGATKLAAYGGAAALGAYGIRGGGKAIGAGAGFVDRRMEISTKVGRGIQRFGADLGISSVAQAGAHIATTRKRAVERHEAKMDKNTEGLPPKQQLAFYEKMALTGNPDQQKAANKKLIKRALSTKAGGEYFEEKYANDAVGMDLKAKGKTAELEAYTQRKRDEDLRTRLAAYEETVAGNEDEEKWVRETREKTPALAKDPDEFMRTEMEKDQNSIRKVRADQLLNAGVLNGGITGADDLFEGNDLNKLSIVGKMANSPGMRGTLLKAQIDRILAAAKKEGMTGEDFIKNREMREKYKAELTGGRYVKLQEDKADGTKKKGDYDYIADGGVSGTTAPPPVATRVSRNEELVHHDLQDVEMILEEIKAEQGKASPNPTTLGKLRSDLGKARNSVLTNGGSYEEAYNIQAGKFRSEEDRKFFVQTFKAFQGKAALNPKEYEKVNMASLSKNKQDSQNEVREAVVQTIDVKDLKNALKAAQSAGNKVAQENIGDVARAINIQANHVVASMESYNARIRKANEEYKASVKASGGTIDPKKLGVEIDVDKALKDIKLSPSTVHVTLDQIEKETRMVFNDVDRSALQKQGELKNDAVFDSYDSTVSPHAQEVLRREKERRRRKP